VTAAIQTGDLKHQHLKEVTRMGLFARKPEAAPAAAAKHGRNSVTCGELNAVIAAVSAEMDTCTTRQTVEALAVLTYDPADGDIVNLNGPAPVTCTALDAAIADLQGLGMPAGTFGSLKQVRALLVQAEEKAARDGVAMVTRAEFDAFVDAVAIVVANIDAASDRRGYPDGLVSRRLEWAVEASAEAPQRAALRRILDRAQVARENAGQRERNQARRLPGQPWSR
jgi:hypothetical protein